MRRIRYVDCVKTGRKHGSTYEKGIVTKEAVAGEGEILSERERAKKFGE